MSTGEILSIEVECSPSSMDSSVGTEFYSGIMLAGFVNAHSHLELAYLRGAIEEGCGFSGFASKIGAVRGQFTDEERKVAVERAEREMKRGGIVAVGDIVNGTTSYEQKSRGEMEYRNFAELFGLRAVNTSAVDELLSYPNTTITPHSIYSLNDELFRNVVTNGESPLSIHFMESAEELSLYEGHGALHDWYKRVGFECDFLHYGSPAERIVRSVPKNRSVLLVHNCCVTQRDIDLIMGHFSAPVYWVLCPQSNHYISRLSPPVELLRANNLNICIGSDSLASTPTLSLLDELRLLSCVPLVERLDWATRCGAEALGFDHLGDIEVGRRPHINILSGIDYDAMELTAQSEIMCVI